MEGQDFSTFFAVFFYYLQVEGKLGLSVLVSSFYSDHVAFVSFYSAQWKLRGTGSLHQILLWVSKTVCAVFIRHNTASTSKASTVPHTGFLCSFP